MRLLVLSFVFLILLQSCEKQNPAQKILEKAIAYHDPNNRWSTFKGELNITMETPNQLDRNTLIRIDLTEDYFYSNAKRDTIAITYEINKGNCSIKLNGSTEYTQEEAKSHRLNCERANMYKNYYTYLYGLPMKLKDPGTHISESVEERNFKGKDYLVLKVTYDESVGTDIWYFYFDPKTYAMEVYQFYRQDEEGNQKNDTGEYILLSEEVVVNDIRMPKIREWYYNKDNAYLGTDILK